MFWDIDIWRVSTVLSYGLLVKKDVVNSGVATPGLTRALAQAT